MSSQEKDQPPTLPYLGSSSSSENPTGQNSKQDESKLERLIAVRQLDIEAHRSRDSRPPKRRDCSLDETNEAAAGQPTCDVSTTNTTNQGRAEDRPSAGYTSTRKRNSNNNQGGHSNNQDFSTRTSLFNTTTAVISERPILENISTNGHSTKLSAHKGRVDDHAAVPYILVVRSLDFTSVLQARRVCKAWKIVCDCYHPLYFPAMYRLPVELIQSIMNLLSPASFNIARHACRAWYLSSLDSALLRRHFRAMGFCETDPLVKNSRNASYLSKRFARECSLGSDRSGQNRLKNTAILDMSDLGSAGSLNFTASACGTHVLICEGCIVHVYRLQPGTRALLEFVVSIVCPRRSLTVSMDTSSRRYSVAVLMEGRMGLVHDIVEQESKHTYRNICSEDDSPRSVAICPQRRCVAFGCTGGIELHWVDALTGQDLNRWFPLTSPSDFLYFLPLRRGIDSAKKLRLISSTTHPEDTTQLVRRFGAGPGRAGYWESWEPGVTHSDHYQAVPLSNGYHVLFIDPSSGALCLGSDAPLGGPTKLLRKIWLIPPEMDPRDQITAEDIDLDSWIRAARNGKYKSRANIYVAGTDLRYGVRIVAGYGDNVVLFSIPPDIFNDAELDGDDDTVDLHPQEVQRTANGTKIPVKILGSFVGYCPGLNDLTIDSGPSMTIYAFSTTGLIRIYQLEGTTEGSFIERRYSIEGAVVRTSGDVDGSTSADEFANGEREQEYHDDWSEWRSSGEALECELFH